MALMISVSGIRGIFGTDLTPGNLTRFAAAYGAWVNGGKVVIGRDTRVTGQICEDLVAATLQSTGCDVIKTGIATTPTVAMAVLQHEAAGAIIISASHNPAENALKMLNAKSEFLDAEQGREVIEISENRSFSYRSYDEIGSITKDPDALEKHIDAILSLPYIDAEKIASANFSIAIDPVNGTGGIALPPLLKELGVDTIHKINEAPSGLFAHVAEPLPEHLGDICALVKEKQCDLGIVTDPDSDRLALVTDEGEPFGEEYTQAAAFDFMLSKKAGPTATNLSSSRAAAEDITKKYGHTCHRSAVGEINVVKKMQEVDAIIGGEGNGGVINPDLHYGRDALVGTAMVLQLLAERDISSSEYRRSLNDYYMRKDKLQLDAIDGDTVLDKAQTLFAGQKPDTTDGVKIDFADGWVHLRKSNTEPIIRVYSEGTTPEKAKELAEMVKDKVLA